MLDQSTNARITSAGSSHSGGENQAFFYIDGIPTKGLWVDIDQITGWDDVSELLSNAFPDSVVDEILCADVEGLARIFYTSSCDSFGMDEWLEFQADRAGSHLDDEVIQAFADNASSWEDVTIQNIEDSYMGEYDSDTAFAEGYADDMGLLMNVPETVRNYFDFEAYWKCELRHYFYESNGHYFRNL